MTKFKNIVVINLFLLIILASTKVFSDDKKDVQEILELIQKDLKTLEKAVYSEKLNDNLNDSTSSISIDQNGEEVLTRHLLKLSEIEKQFQELTNKFEEINFKIDKLSNRLSKVQADNQMRFQELENNSIVSGDVNTGTVIASDTSLVTNGGLQGYRVSSDTSATNRGIFLANADIDDLFLGAGDYWLRWSLTGSDSFSGPWVPVVSDARTGNAQQSIAGGLFDTLTDSGNQLTVELPFSVNGSATTNEVSSPSVLAIFGLGLLSLAGARRRRKAA